MNNNKCLFCGQETGYGGNEAAESFTFGYGSRYDGQSVCWDCASEVIDPLVSLALALRDFIRRDRENDTD